MGHLLSVKEKLMSCELVFLNFFNCVYDTFSGDKLIKIDLPVVKH